MKNIIAFCFVLVGFSYLHAQTTTSIANPNANKVYTVVQTRPQFPGDINKWLAANLTYPDDAQKNKNQGTSFVSFIVERNGSVSGVGMMRSSGYTSLDNEAMKVISMMPKWTPGMQNGQTVRVQYMVPVHFVLNDTPSSAPARQ